jgi:5-methyltetrahydrofolate--homocysteine methyltransferase
MVKTVVESKTKTAVLGFDQPFCVIGERINPTGRKKLAAELEAGDYSTVEKDALAQVMAGANILDINAGVVYNSNPNPNETEPPVDDSLDQSGSGFDRCAPVYRQFGSRSIGSRFASGRGAVHC